MGENQTCLNRKEKLRDDYNLLTQHSAEIANLVGSLPHMSEDEQAAAPSVVRDYFQQAASCHAKYFNQFTKNGNIESFLSNDALGNREIVNIVATDDEATQTALQLVAGFAYQQGHDKPCHDAYSQGQMYGWQEGTKEGYEDGHQEGKIKGVLMTSLVAAGLLVVGLWAQNKYLTSTNKEKVQTTAKAIVATPKVK